MPYAWPLVFLFYGLFAQVLLWSTSRIVPNILRDDSSGIYHFDKVVSSNFLVLLRYSFLIFSFISTCLMVVSFQYSHVFIVFFFSERSNFSCFGSSISSVISCFPLFIISMGHFLRQIPSLCSDCIFSLRVFVFPIFFFIFCK